MSRCIRHLVIRSFVVPCIMPSTPESIFNKQTEHGLTLGRTKANDECIFCDDDDEDDEDVSSLPNAVNLCR